MLNLSSLSRSPLAEEDKSTISSAYNKQCNEREFIRTGSGVFCKLPGRSLIKFLNKFGLRFALSNAYFILIEVCNFVIYTDTGFALGIHDFNDIEIRANPHLE